VIGLLQDRPLYKSIAQTTDKAALIGYAEQQYAVRVKNASNLFHDDKGLGNVLQHVIAKYNVESSVAEGETH